MSVCGLGCFDCRLAVGSGLGLGFDFGDAHGFAMGRGGVMGRWRSAGLLRVTHGYSLQAASVAGMASADLHRLRCPLFYKPAAVVAVFAVAEGVAADSEPDYHHSEEKDH